MITPLTELPNIIIEEIPLCAGAVHVLVFIKLEPESNDCGPSLAMLQLGIINSTAMQPHNYDQT